MGGSHLGLDLSASKVVVIHRKKYTGFGLAPLAPLLRCSTVEQRAWLFYTLPTELACESPVR